MGNKINRLRAIICAILLKIKGFAQMFAHMKIGEVMGSKELEIKNIDVGLAPSAIAQDIFTKAVSPVMGILKQEGGDSVKEFSFCAMWLAMGLYVNNLSTKDAEKALNHATINIIIHLKKLRGEV